MSENKNNNKQNNTNSSENVKKRFFILNENIKPETIKGIATGIIEVNRYDKEQEEKDSTYVRNPITLIVNTYGGDVYEANFLVGVIDSSDTPVHTYVYGKAMSAGFFIFSSGHKRFAHSLATFMFHDGSVGMHNKMANLREDLEHYSENVEVMKNYILSVTNIPKRKLDEAIEYKRDLYINAKDAHAYGLVDEIIKSKRQEIINKYNK